MLPILHVTLRSLLSGIFIQISVAGFLYPAHLAIAWRTHLPADSTMSVATMVFT